MSKKLEFRVKKDGTRIIEADTSLQEKIGGKISLLITEENIAAAEDIITEEGKDFPAQMQSDLQQLLDAFIEFRSKEFTEDATKKNCPYFQQVKAGALAIKGSSGIYGYALATEIARLLFTFCETHNCTSALGHKTINLHINALRVVYSKNITGDGGIIGKQLLSELQTLIAQDQ